MNSYGPNFATEVFTKKISQNVALSFFVPCHMDVIWYASPVTKCIPGVLPNMFRRVLNTICQNAVITCTNQLFNQMEGIQQATWTDLQLHVSEILH
jgi:hypothetical protein